MQIEVKIPEVGESVQEAVLAQWYKRDGDVVKKGELLFVIETDKVTLEVSAEADGVLKVLVQEGETVAIGAVVGILETELAAGAKESKSVPADRGEEEPLVAAKAAQKPAPERMPGAADVVAPKESTAPSAPASGPDAGREARAPSDLSPSVRSLVMEKGVDVSKIVGTGPGGRITKGDVLLYLDEEYGAEESIGRGDDRQGTSDHPGEAPSGEAEGPPGGGIPAAMDRALSRPAPSLVVEEGTTRKPMSRIRLRIAERLLEARRNTAMLTTFNEIDMSAVQALRSRFKAPFREKHGVSLGIMSFFVKASIQALKEFPQVNAFIEGKEIVYHGYYHIGIAVGAERGLVVPVIRHADGLGFAEIERVIAGYVEKVRENRLELSDLEGGTFTISNGGVYGSLLSTPILNTPQSGILGMHKIEDRPVAVDGQVVIRQMMYVALSYDHRIIDGREAVTFLKRIKECVEAPERIMMEI